ncbi:AAA family ATPase [Ornithinibacillus halotolerans]|uniref:ATPase AAA-type core domain-containing protein n=1 Tax=Ornithinibacillus halotolerans TaxID=1274357 RepID=A0A916RRL4_9BACI|nr:AAA family ATPase [Ornithinibacillus halotolerans]GGA66301.1 hypothetical protein GCM10008025_07650 [Ornithinibacillus halotolerans]
MKTSLLFALRHEPDLLIMDEPTSGLDPIFRRKLLDLLQELMIKENQTIFLSTHITNDLDKIADYIVFINEGKILLHMDMEEIKESFYIVKGKKDLIDSDTRDLFTGIQITQTGFHGLFEGNASILQPLGETIVLENATLEDMMYYMTRKEA